MKLLVDEMPYFKTDCPFYAGEDCNGDVCQAGPQFLTCRCEYFKMGRDPYYCNWLKEIHNEV